MKRIVILGLFLVALNVNPLQLYADEAETDLQEEQVDPGIDLQESQVDSEIDLQESQVDLEVSKLRQEQQEQIKVLQKDIRDPFTPFLPSKVEDQATDQIVGETVEARLYGIGLGPESAYAILNGDVYYEGEEGDGIKLLKVRKNEVEIEMGGARSTLYILSDDELKRLGQRRERKEKARRSVSA